MTLQARDVVRDWLETLALRPQGLPRVVGINGPQGGGKSTLCAGLVEDLAARGTRAVTLSVDDFYLPRQQQLALAAAHPGNRFMEHRGYPGTHDVELGSTTLRALVEGRPVRLPRYDKSAHGGRGDRAPESTWTMVDGRVDVVLLEGWMLGFTPVDTTVLPDPALATANHALHAYRAWHDHVGAWVIMVAQHPRAVVEWRVDAERARRASGSPALSDEDARDYVERFLPAYEAWLPGLVSASGSNVPRLRLVIANNRAVVDVIRA